MILSASTIYGGFWRRTAAALIDLLLLGLVSAPLLHFLSGGEWREVLARPIGAAGGSWPDILVNYLLPAVLTVFFWVRLGGTPGKLLLDVRIVDARTGAPLRPGQALLRYFGYLVSALPFMLGFLWIVWDKRKQGFHDKLAGTIVVMDDESAKSLDELQRECA